MSCRPVAQPAVGRKTAGVRKRGSYAARPAAAERCAENRGVGSPLPYYYDRFFIQVYTDPYNIQGSTLVFLNADVPMLPTSDADRADLTDDTIGVSVGNLQIHISSCK